MTASTDTRYKVALSVDEIAAILEALHDQRDPFGEPPTPFEDRLLSIQRNIEQHERGNA